MKRNLLVLAWVCAAPLAYGIPLSGSLTVGNGLIATGDWNSPNSHFNWNVTYDTVNGVYVYDYEWNGVRRDLSHIIVQLTPGLELDSVVIGSGSQASVEYRDPIGTSGNQGIPSAIAALYGVKLNSSSDGHPFRFTFVTPSAPVAGDFYAKDGGGVNNPVIAYNDFEHGYFIARPDGDSRVPDASGTLLLLGFSLFGLGGLKRKLNG